MKRPKRKLTIKLKKPKTRLMKPKRKLRRSVRKKKMLRVIII